jgi:hypothetical protein
MAISPSQFEWLFLHARLLPELALSSLAQSILDAPREAPAMQIGAARDAIEGAPVVFHQRQPACEVGSVHAREQRRPGAGQRGKQCTTRHCTNCSTACSRLARRTEARGALSSCEKARIHVGR